MINCQGMKIIQIHYDSTLWNVVKTTFGWINEPPQIVLPTPSSMIATVHGNSPNLASSSLAYCREMKCLIDYAIRIDSTLKWNKCVRTEAEADVLVDLIPMPPTLRRPQPLQGSVGNVMVALLSLGLTTCSTVTVGSLNAQKMLFCSLSAQLNWAFDIRVTAKCTRVIRRIGIIILNVFKRFICK